MQEPNQHRRMGFIQHLFGKNQLAIMQNETLPDRFDVDKHMKTADVPYPHVRDAVEMTTGNQPDYVKNQYIDRAIELHPNEWEAYNAKKNITHQVSESLVKLMEGDVIGQGSFPIPPNRKEMEQSKHVPEKDRAGFNVHNIDPDAAASRAAAAKAKQEFAGADFLTTDKDHDDAMRSIKGFMDNYPKSGDLTPTGPKVTTINHTLTDDQKRKSNREHRNADMPIKYPFDDTVVPLKPKTIKEENEVVDLKSKKPLLPVAQAQKARMVVLSGRTPRQNYNNLTHAIHKLGNEQPDSPLGSLSRHIKTSPAGDLPDPLEHHHVAHLAALAAHATVKTNGLDLQPGDTQRVRNVPAAYKALLTHTKDLEDLGGGIDSEWRRQSEEYMDSLHSRDAYAKFAAMKPRGNLGAVGKYPKQHDATPANDN